MTIKTFKILGTVLALLVIASCNQKFGNSSITDRQTAPLNINWEEVTLDGASVLTFGPDNTLFVGDSKAGLVHAIPTTATELKDPIPYNNWGVDRKIAAKLGVKTSDLIINDMKVHPISQEVYIAVKNGHAPNAKSLIAIINPTNDDIRFLNFADVNKTQVSIQSLATATPNFWRDIPAYTLNITDIDYHDGHIYVAGLTNGEFASTLRKIPYPFNGDQSKTGSIEMFHAVHTQKETRAPIRTMTFEEVNGVPTLIAAYTCTPLVSMPVSEIKEGNHIKAKTVAELGFGNVPIDMLTFTAREWDGSYDKKLLITNKMRSGSIISLKDFAEANKGEGLSSFTNGPEGVDIFPVPLAGVMHIADQNQMMLTILRRNIDTGGIDLLSKLKGSYFRLSDFINEYDFADYEYPEGSDMYREYHNMARPMEGYPEFVTEKKN